MKRPIVRHLGDRTRVEYLKVKILGQNKPAIRLSPTTKTPIMDRVEAMGRRLVLGLTIGFCVWMFSSIIIESLDHALASPTYIPVHYESQQLPPILERICKAESGLKHFDKSGKVLTPKNKDGTFDIGICQINSIHLEAAKKLGLDLYKEKDNKKFAKHLFFTQGSVPWRESAYGKWGWINN